MSWLLGSEWQDRFKHPSAYKSLGRSHGHVWIASLSSQLNSEIPNHEIPWLNQWSRKRRLTSRRWGFYWNAQTSENARGIWCLLQSLAIAVSYYLPNIPLNGVYACDIGSSNCPLTFVCVHGSVRENLQRYVHLLTILKNFVNSPSFRSSWGDHASS